MIVQLHSLVGWCYYFWPTRNFPEATVKITTALSDELCRTGASLARVVVYYTQLWVSPTWPSSGPLLHSSSSHWLWNVLEYFSRSRERRKTVHIANTWLILRSKLRTFMMTHLSFVTIPHAYLVRTDTEY